MAEAGLISEKRATGIRRFLIAGLAVAGIVALLGLLLLFNDFGGYGLVVIIVAAALGAAAYVSLRALREVRPAAGRTCMRTGILFLVLSLPLVPIWVGLLTAITGVGLLVVVLAPEHEAA